MQDNSTPDSNNQPTEPEHTTVPKEIVVSEGLEQAPTEESTMASAESDDTQQVDNPGQNDELPVTETVQTEAEPQQPTPIIENPQQFVASAPAVAPKKNKKILILIIGIIGVIVAAIIAASLVYAFISSAPAKKLETAVINSASTKGLQQEYTVKGKVNDTDLNGSVVVQSDFSDPSTPKSTGNFAVDVSVFGIAIKIKSDFTCVSATDCYVKYTEFTIPEELTSEKPAFLNQWLKFNPSDDTAATADPFSLLTGINTVLGEVVTGNITGSAKTNIEEAAKNGKTYAYSAHSSEDINGAATIKYTMQLQKDDVLKLNKVVAEQYGIPNSFTDAADFVGDAYVWVDTASKRIIKVSYEKDGVTSSITYSKFDEVPAITAPTEFLNPDEYNQIL